MAKSDPATCEIKVEDGWLPVTATDAHARHRAAPKRCPECHGPVMTTSNYSPPFRIRMSHRKAHNGCSLMPGHFTGTRSPHPQALT